MLGKNLTMLRTYHKSGALSGVDKLIPHSIDGVTADIMIQDLALTRPFGEIAAHICYPDKPEIKEMYRNHIFVNDTRLFNTDQLSAAMARESVSFIGFGLGVNSWRHISTAFKRKLGRFAEELLEEDDQDTVEALQAGHNRSTENRVYGLSPDALASGAEDLLPQFIQASTNWQLLMRAVPGGLKLAYTDARAHCFKQLGESGKFGPDFEATVPPGRAANPAKAKTEIHLSTDALADRIAVKLEEKMMTGIEQRLVARVADALAPMLEGIIKEAMKTAGSRRPAGVPTNDIDFDDIYDGEECGNDSNGTPNAAGESAIRNQHMHKLIFISGQDSGVPRSSRDTDIRSGGCRRPQRHACVLMQFHS